MKIRNVFCLILALVSFSLNFTLFQSLSPTSPLFGKDSTVIIIGVVGFFVSICALYLGIPYFDEETQQKRPLTLTLASGISLGFFNLVASIILTPGVLAVWGSTGLQKIITSLSK